MKFYIASGLENRACAAQTIKALQAAGHFVTYDWTKHGDMRQNGHECLSDIATNEVLGVRSAELVLVLLPGGKGTHTELGIALSEADKKKIIIWSETGREFSDWQSTCAFYHHPSVTWLVCGYDELVERVLEQI